MKTQPLYLLLSLAAVIASSLPTSALANACATHRPTMRQADACTSTLSAIRHRPVAGSSILAWSCLTCEHQYTQCLVGVERGSTTRAHCESNYQICTKGCQ
jgi:hypothetical protein